MPLRLSDYDRALLAGERGPAARLAMSIVTRMAEVFGAPELMDVTGAHIDSTIYVGEAGLEFAERLAGLGARVVVPTTLNVSGLDEHHWQEWSVPPDWAHAARRQMIAYESMGCRPTWTCAPYQDPDRPRFGQQVAWGESNAIAFANSVLGARTERYPDLLDICCAITGRVPAMGLHLTPNRAAEILFRLVDVPPRVQQDDAFYPVLGYLLGRSAADRVPVVDGLTVKPTEDQLKALAAAAASSGAVALFHIAGVTPEAPTVEAACQGRAPIRVVDVRLDDLRRARRALTTLAPDCHSECKQEESRLALDAVVVGCPHLSLAEFRRLASLVAGQSVHPGVTFLAMSGRDVALSAAEAGYLRALADFGGRLTVDTCILASPMLPPETTRLMTDSAKCAYYAPGLLGARVAFGSLEDCVRSAVAGHVAWDESLWNG